MSACRPTRPTCAPPCGSMRMGREGDFLAQVLLPGGTCPSSSHRLDARGDGLADAFRGTALEQAAQLAAKLAQPERRPLTAFERACDDALTAYLAAAQRVPFGEEAVVAICTPRRAELTAIRTMFPAARPGWTASDPGPPAGYLCVRRAGTCIRSQ
ncbi:MAG: hypothetical protein V8S34_03205 [Lawsonibacter sp.]